MSWQSERTPYRCDKWRQSRIAGLHKKLKDVLPRQSLHPRNNSKEMGADKMGNEDTKSVEMKASQQKFASVMKDAQIKEIEGDLE